MRLVLAGRGEGEGWGDDAATGEDVAEGEGDMEVVRGEGDIEDVIGEGDMEEGGEAGAAADTGSPRSGSFRTRDTSGEGLYNALGTLPTVCGSGLWVRQAGIFLGRPLFLFCPRGFDLTSEDISKTSVLYIRATECLHNLLLIPKKQSQ